MKNVFVATVLTSLGVATSAAADSLNVAYTSSATPVPTMAEWAMIAMAMTLGAAAVFLIRRKNLGGGLAIGLAAVIGLGALGLAGQSQAAEIGLDLDGLGPDSLSIPNASSHSVTVTNRGGTSVTLTSVTVENELDSREFVIVPGVGTTCVVNLPLAVNATCTVELSGFVVA